MTTNKQQPAGPLDGLRIVDISTVVAGPFAAGLLGDYGAEIVKVEMPGAGDSAARAGAAQGRCAAVVEGHQPQQERRHARPAAARRPRPVREADGRRRRAGREFPAGHARRLGHHAGLAAGTSIHGSRSCGSPASARTGPMPAGRASRASSRPMSGFTQICGEEDGRPLHLGYPISDAVAGLFGALGILAALHDLARNPERRGQEIDCSATEAMLRTLEFLAIEYDQLGAVRTRSGNRSQYAAPGNVYRTADDKWASIAASTQSIFDAPVRGPRPAVTCWRIHASPLNPARVKNYLRARRDRRRRHRQADPGRTARDVHPPRGRLLADLRHRRRLRRSAVRGSRRHRARARRRAGLGAHAGRGAALFRNAGRGAPRRPGDGPAQ